MVAKALRGDGFARSGVFRVALAAAITTSCGGTPLESEGTTTPAKPEAVETSKPVTPVTASGGPQTLEVAGGMDSGGNTIGRRANTSPDGRVTTTLGDWFVDVRSEPAIAHVFQEAAPGAPERLFLRHYVETDAGLIISFEFDYADGIRTFPITENGALVVTKGGAELVGRAGTATIEPVGADAVRISLVNVAVGDPLVEGGALDVLGSGVIEGPSRKVCWRASDVIAAEPEAPTPAPVHEAAWISQFCGP